MTLALRESQTVLSLSRIERTDDLWRIESDWKALQNADPNATFFSTWEWGSAAAHHFAADTPLRVLFVHENGEPIALAPLAERRCIGLRTLVLVGTGLRDYSRADYQDFLLAPGHEEAALESIVSELASMPDWDAIWLQELPAASAVRRLLPAIARREGWRVVTRACGDVYQVDLPDTWDEYAERLSTNTRSATGRKQRKLQREHAARFERITTNEETTEAMDRLIDLHTRRWNSSGRPGIFHAPSVQAFHHEVALKAQAAGMLDLTLLKSGSEVIGARYCFEFGGVHSFYASGFDPDARWSPFSLGLLMDANGIRDAIERGLATEDLLRGDGDYKQRYAPAHYENFDLCIYRSEAAYRRARACQEMRRLVRKIPGIRHAKRSFARVLGYETLSGIAAGYHEFPVVTI